MYDEDGIDGSFERALRAATREDATAAATVGFCAKHQRHYRSKIGCGACSDEARAQFRPPREKRDTYEEGGDSHEYVAALEARLAAAEAAQREAEERVRVLTEAILDHCEDRYGTRDYREANKNELLVFDEELYAALAPATPATDAGDAQEERNE
jgi:hypothetical protein